jgi:hypothetical protein
MGEDEVLMTSIPEMIKLHQSLPRIIKKLYIKGGPLKRLLDG